jgi:tRNA G10  N-methylase Trm11
MGVKKIIGTDLSEKAVHDSQVNLRWLKREFQTSQIKNIEIKQIDARKISNFLGKNSVDLIVTEPYLGPQRKIDDIEKVQKSLKKLYEECLAEFPKILKDQGRIVMIWPILRKAQNQFMKIDLKNFKIVNYLPENLNLPISQRNTLVYGRKDQKVWREIAVLEKNK